MWRGIKPFVSIAVYVSASENKTTEDDYHEKTHEIQP